MQPFVSLRLLHPLLDVLAGEPALLAELQTRFRLDLDAPDLSVAVSLDRYQPLLEWLVEQGHPFIVYELARRYQPGGLGVLDYYLLSCATVGEALGELLRFRNILVQDLQYLRLEHDEKELRIHFTDDAALMRRMSRCRVQLIGGVVIRLLQILAGDDRLLPLRAETALPPGPDPERAKQFFGPGLVHDAPHSLLAYPGALWDRPLRQANPRLKQILLSDVQAEHDRLSKTQTLAQQVIDWISAARFSAVSQAQLCESLGLSESTFKRRLKEENQTFSELFNLARQQYAIRRLTESEDKIEALALELGFSERATFERSFRQWLGLSPSQFRSETRSALLTPITVSDLLDRLPPLSNNARAQLLAALDEEGSLRRLTELIHQDPVLAARLLAVANSPRFGAGKVRTLADAIQRWLGSEEVRRLMLSHVMASPLLCAENRVWLADQLCYSLVLEQMSGLALRHQMLDSPPDPALLRTVALLRNLGLLLVGSFAPAALTSVEQARSGLTRMSDVYRIERQCWGMSRYELGFHLLLRMQLPLPIALHVKALDPDHADLSPDPRLQQLLAPCAHFVDYLQYSALDPALFDAWKKAMAKVSTFSEADAQQLAILTMASITPLSDTVERML